MIRNLIVSVIFSLVCVNSFGEVIKGTPRIIDGDTIEVANRKVRLLCIDTPETKYRGRSQYCLDNETKCGELATKKLKELVGDSAVICDIYSKDMYGRDLGICYDRWRKDKSYNEQMLEYGYAFYYPCKEKKEWKKHQINAEMESIGLFDKEKTGGMLNPKLWRKNGGTNK